MKMIEKMKMKLEGLNLYIHPTTTNRTQFETNVKNEFMCEYLFAMVKTLETHFGYIGETVYKYQKWIAVITYAEYEEKKREDLSYSILNPIEKNPFSYSIDDFEIFQKAYIKYQIEYLSNELINNSVYQNSTNPFSNLEFQWIIECKQYLIEFFSDILES